jgi:hypothetical protein
MRAVTGMCDIAVRIALCSLGCLAVGWSAFTLPTILRQSVISNNAKHIIQGDTFKEGALDALRSSVGSVDSGKWSHPSILGSAAIVELRYLEQAMANADQPDIDSRMDGLIGAIRNSLQNAPADPFLWLVLFWLENTHNGFKRANFQYLQMSYATGPSEGWVAVRRHRLALALYNQLPPALKDASVAEFARLVDSNYIADAADILTGPAWPIREPVLAGLKDVDLVSRQTFAKTVYRLGYDVAVPGVDQQPFRPWN